MSEKTEGEISDDGTATIEETYIRKISNQAETDEKPIEKVADLQQWLTGFGEKNRAHLEKHSIKHSGPKSRSRCTGARAAVDATKELNETVAENVTGDESTGTAENAPTDIPTDVPTAVPTDIPTDIHDEPKEVEGKPFATPAPALKMASSSIVGHDNHDYIRTISKQAETDERPLESVSELKRWLMQSGRNDNAARCERKLVNELSKRMSREEAVTTAKSYLRKISDQAVCEELPLLHVDEAKQILLDFERKNKEHFERNSVKHPNKRLSRCRGAKDDKENLRGVGDEDSGKGNIDTLAALPEKEDRVEKEEDRVEEVEGRDEEEEDRLEEEEDMPEDDEVAEEEMSVEQQDLEGAQEQISLEEEDVTDVVLEEVEEEDETVEVDEADEALGAGNVGEEETIYKDEETFTEEAASTTIEDKSMEYGGSKLCDLDYEETSHVDERGEQEPKIQVADAAAVFRKRCSTDSEVKGIEEAERPKKKRRGLGMLKKLACPNPVKVFCKDAKAGLPKEPVVTMSSSADEDCIASNRAPPQVHHMRGNCGTMLPQADEVTKNKYLAADMHTLLSPNSDITMNDFQAIGINRLEESLTRYAGSPASSASTGVTDVLPTKTIIAKAGIGPGDEVAADHLKWLENKFNVR